MRKTINITISTPGRDFRKVFVLTEKPAIQADKWGVRAMLAMTKSGMQIPDEIMQMGIIGVLAVGIHRLSGVAYEDMEPLLDEMLSCVKFMPEPSRPDVVRELFPDDIEEVGTLSTLRKEVFKLHVDFTEPADQSKSPGGLAGETTSATQTSPAQ